MRDPRTAAIVGVAIVATAVLLAALALRPRTADERLAAARALAGHVTVTAEVTTSSLGVTRAMADFGVDAGLRMVPVRIVEELAIAVRVETDRELVLARPPRVCLVGPFWNPLDAGLSDRCWGEPDLGEIVAGRLVAVGSDRIVLRPGEPLDLVATLARGETRCDYAPGEWRLQIDAEPVVDGVPQPRQDLADVAVVVPLEPAGALPFRPNAETRFCSYPAAVYDRQGEPAFTED
jgi:hypothetical protein